MIKIPNEREMYKRHKKLNRLDRQHGIASIQSFKMYRLPKCAWLAELVHLKNGGFEILKYIHNLSGDEDYVLDLDTEEEHEEENFAYANY